MRDVRAVSPPQTSMHVDAPPGAESRKGVGTPHVPGAEGADQSPSVQAPQSTSGLLRKGRALAAMLMAAARSNPGVVVDLACFATNAATDANGRLRRGQVSVQPLGRNPRPDGIELLVLDTCSQPGGHGDWTSYVANSHLDKTANIETLLLKDGVIQDFCGSLEQLISISRMKDPPEVLSISFGGSPALEFERLFQDKVLDYFVLKEGPDQSKWSSATIANYKFNLEGLSKKVIQDFYQTINTKCDDGSSFSMKRAEAFRALIEAGVTVVLAAGNDGSARAKMVDAGLDVPHGFFTDSLYSNGEILPAGVIVAGGSEVGADGSLSVAFYSSPNPAVDVLAPSNDVQVNPEGVTLSGTSFAAPKVAALAAKILAINPSLKPADVERIIVSTAIPLDHDQGGSQVGVVNEASALELATKTLQQSGS